MPAVKEVAQRLRDVRSPSLRAPRPLARRAPRPPPRLIRRRQRLLTLPVIVAIMGRVGWRRGPSIAEVQQVLGREGLLGMAPRHVSPQAIPKRRAVLPAAVLGQRLAAVGARLQAQVPPTVPPPGGAPVRERFSLLALGDGATREALRNKTQGLRARAGLVLGGKRRVMVAAVSHRPRWQLDTADAAAHAKRCAAELRAAGPGGGRWVFALGFVSFLWFDACTNPQKVFVTRRRAKSASRTVQVLRQGAS